VFTAHHLNVNEHSSIETDYLHQKTEENLSDTTIHVSHVLFVICELLAVRHGDLELDFFSNSILDGFIEFLCTN